MSKKRLFGGAVFVSVLAAASVLALTASARPAKQDDTVKLGFITKFPVDFYFTLVDAVEGLGQVHAGRVGDLRQRQERHG